MRATDPGRRDFLLGSAAGALAGPHLAHGRADPPLGELPVTGRDDPNLAAFDRLMAAFVTLYEVPGAALAVTRKGKLVYARGFGYADVEKKEPVRPDGLFRVASLSKPVTAAAVLRLVDAGKLRLRDKAFDLVKVEPHLKPGAKPDPRLKDVTVLHLLHHTAGWDRAASGDPMVGRSVAIAKALKVDPPARADHIVRYMAGKPLDFGPGQRHAYSNFGYCLLGRVIEAVAGKGYEEYVRAEVLAPLGVTRMRLGKTLPEGRAAGEVRYYDERGRTAPCVVGPQLGKPVPTPYGAWSLEAMDAHGGWVGSAVDLVRFAAAFDDPARSKVLSRDGVATMFAWPDGAAGYEPDGRQRTAYYGCGWSVVADGKTGAQNHFHTGLLDGAASLLVRRADGLNWAVLFNTGAGPAGDHLGGAIDLYVHRAANRVTAWPDGDLFGNFS